MCPVASGGHLRDNQPHRTCRRLSFPCWTVRASSANRPKAIIFFARPSLQCTCRLVFAYLRRPIRGYTKDQHILCSSSVSTYVPLGLRVPSASRPKVVSPAPRNEDVCWRSNGGGVHRCRSNGCGRNGLCCYAVYVIM